MARKKVESVPLPESLAAVMATVEPPVIRVGSDDDLLRTENARLREENARLTEKVRKLSERSAYLATHR